MTRPDLHPSQTSDLALLSNTASMPALSVVLVRAAAIWATWRKTAQTRKTLRTLEPHMPRSAQAVLDALTGRSLWTCTNPMPQPHAPAARGLTTARANPAAPPERPDPVPNLFRAGRSGPYPR